MNRLPIVSLFILALFSYEAAAQNSVRFNGLDADYYDTKGETAVLLLHGSLAHNRMEIISTIATLLLDDYDIPVLAPNLSFNSAGREGMLDCGILHTHRHFDALTEISAWITYLKQEKGFERIVVSAHSRGGAQASAYLSDEPDSAVKGAVMIAPAVYDAQRQEDSYSERYGVELSSLLQDARAMNPDAVMDAPGFVFCQGAKVTAGSFLGYYAPDSRRDTPSNLAQIKTIPVTVIAGSEDQVVADLPKKIANNSRIGENIRFEMIDGADHFFRDLYADDVALLISELIEGLE